MQEIVQSIHVGTRTLTQTGKLLAIYGVERINEKPNLFFPIKFRKLHWKTAADMFGLNLETRKDDFLRRNKQSRKDNNL